MREAGGRSARWRSLLGRPAAPNPPPPALTWPMAAPADRGTGGSRQDIPWVIPPPVIFASRLQTKGYCISTSSYREFLDGEAEGGGRGPQGLIEVGYDYSGPRPGQ
jgi:hypothetical protein